MPESPKPDSTLPATDANFNEEGYLGANPDVARAVLTGAVRSGRVHFEAFGRAEGRRIVGTDEARLSRRSSVLDVLLEMIPTILKRRIKEAMTAELAAQLRGVRERLRDNEVLVDQLLSVLRHEAGIPPPPPRPLQIRSAGAYLSEFVESGFATVCRDLNQMLDSVGRELRDFRSILDFGCGCGRSIRAVAGHAPGSKLHGIDVDRQAIDWLSTHYSKFGEFSVAPASPPTSFEPKQFDFVFGISVFTHMPEEMQHQWLEELARITRPAGYVILSTHGESFYANQGADVQRAMRDRGFFYGDFGPTEGLPDYYRTAFHSHEYIRREWSRYFDVLDVRTLALQGYQDLVLLGTRS